MATLKIDLGLKSFEVCDTDGNTLGTIRFNPSDPGLLPRWKDAQKENTTRRTVWPCLTAR